MSSADRIAILGIRHHGPGSARSVRRALHEFAPTRILIEGPPELDKIVSLTADETMVAPIAGLVYGVDEPRNAAFYPLADFSPEWVTLRWAAQRSVPVNFADLPAANGLAMGTDLDPSADDVARSAPQDPIGALAEAAGYDDAERWWEDAIEQRSDGGDALARFDIVREAMAAFRESAETVDWRTRMREAAMRRILRKAAADPQARIAFICGAYHAPVLHPDAWPTQKSDNDILRKPPKMKVAATWAPWTSQRLAYASGYGAGVSSPGWYQHLFTTNEDVVATWMVLVARSLRDEQLNASAASAVEATRLAESLAALRGRPLAGLTEVTDAARAVLCDGSDVSLALIHERLVVGRSLGTIPDDTPMVPLARDLTASQRKLRLKVKAEPNTITVDLRQPSQLARSVLLHRCNLLGVVWGRPVDVGQTKGTFKEGWVLEWRPELAVDLILASVHGTTVASAAAAKVAADATASRDLQELAGLVESCLLAELPDGLASVLTMLAQRTAQSHDAQLLMEAVEPLARTHRYGDVRGIDTGAIASVLHVLVTRAAIGMGRAVSSLDDDRAEGMRRALDAAHQGVALLEDLQLRSLWFEALERVADQAGVHGSVQGRIVRLLLDAGRFDGSSARHHLSRALSTGTDPHMGAAWLDGFLAGEAVLLLHDHELLAIIDEWVQGVGESTFEDVLPLVRRTFSRFEKAERRQIGERLRNVGPADGATDGAEIDVERAAPAVAKVVELLGLTP